NYWSSVLKVFRKVRNSDYFRPARTGGLRGTVGGPPSPLTAHSRRRILETRPLAGRTLRIRGGPSWTASIQRRASGAFRGNGSSGSPQGALPPSLSHRSSTGIDLRGLRQRLPATTGRRKRSW